MAKYGVYNEKGFVFVTEGTNIIAFTAPGNSVNYGFTINLAGRVGPKRNAIGKPLGKTQQRVTVQGAKLTPTTSGDESEVEEVLRLLANWVYTTTDFPYKLYWVYSLTDNIVTNHNDIGVASVASNVITLDTSPLVADAEIGNFVKVESGTGAGDYYFIIDNATGTITTAEASPNVAGDSVIDVFVPNYHQFFTKNTSSKQSYLEGGVDGNVTYFRDINVFHLGNVIFNEYNRG